MVLLDIGDSFQQAMDEFFAFLPNLLGAIVILIIGWFVARLVGRLVARGLHSAGADRALATGTAGQYRERLAPSFQASRLVGRITFWFVFGLAIMLAVSALGIEALSQAVEGVVGYLPNVIAAILILLVAIAIAGAIGGLAQRLMGGTMLGKLVQTTVPVLVITIALFMALVQLKIAVQIVVATYVLVLGAIALGFALAFGLGGRGVAERMLQGAYESGQRAMPELKEDARTAREQAATEAEAVREEVETPSSDADRPGATVRPGRLTG
jgi:Conserved TM helix